MDFTVRTATAADGPALLELFRRAGTDSPSETLWGHVESEAAIYLDPYLQLAPDSLFLAEADGEFLGYLTGCPDTASFPSEQERFTAAIRAHKLFGKREPRAFFLRSMRDVAVAKLRRQPSPGELADSRWPAHLHINVVPRARGAGVAAELMTRWQDRLRDLGSPGCHLNTLVENTRAVRFFQRAGFLPHGPTPLIPGVRNQHERVHQQTMVWSTHPSARA